MRVFTNLTSGASISEIILILLALISVMAVFIALVISLIKKIFGCKLSPAFHYYIWLIFLARLIFPLSPESNISVYNAAFGFYRNITAEPAEKPEDNMPAETSEEEIIRQMNLSNLPERYFPENISDNSYDGFCEEPEGSNAHTSETLEVQETETANILNILTRANITNALFFIYLIVAFGSIAFYVLNYIRYTRKIKKSLIPVSESEQQFLDEIKTSLNIKKNIKLFRSKESMLINIFSPSVILADNCPENGKKAVLTHELLHYKNKDNLVNIILSVIKYIYWFNPFIRYFIRRIKDDMEILCDVKSINKLNYRKKDYTMMLFNSSNDNKNKVPSGITQMTSNGKQLKNRIKFISSFKKPGKISSFLAAVLVTVLLFTTLTNPVSTVIAESGEPDIPDEIDIIDEISSNELAIPESNHLFASEQSNDKKTHIEKFIENLEKEIERLEKESENPYIFYPDWLLKMPAMPNPNYDFDFNWEDYEFDWESLFADTKYWTSTRDGDNIIYELKDGTKIISRYNDGMNFSFSNANSDDYCYIKFNMKSTIEYVNGIKVQIPANTIIEFENNTFIVVTGGETTITQANGTSSTVPKNTILDNKGNVSKDTSLLNIITNNYEYGKVKNVNIDALKGTYRIEKSETNQTAVEITGYEKFIELLNVEYSAATGDLKISYDKDKAKNMNWNREIWTSSKIKITVKLAYDGNKPELLTYKNSGVSTLGVKIPFKKLSANISSVGDINAKDISFDEADIRTSGVGNVIFHDADVLKATVSGVGDINFNNAKTATLRLSGTGGIYGNDVNVLDASISGSGDIKVNECEEFTASLSGAGDIRANKVNKSVSAKLSGIGDIRIKAGEIETFTANISGSGSINAKNVTADKADVTIKDWGTVEIGKVNNELIKDCAKYSELIIHEKGPNVK